LLAAFAVWKKLLSRKPAKEVESAGEQGSSHSVATDLTLVVQDRQEPPAGALPAVQEEMAETSRDHAPQLAPVPVAAHEDGGGISHWPLQDSASIPETPPRDIEHDLTTERQPAIDTGKGKEIATHEDH